MFLKLYYIFTFFLSGLFLININSFADQTNPYIVDYPFKTAVIHYDGFIKSGYHADSEKIYKGSETFYLKKGKTLKITSMLLPGTDNRAVPVKTYHLITPDYVYIADTRSGKGFKIDNPKKYGRTEYEKLTHKEKEAFHDRMERRGVVSLDLLGIGRKVGTDTLLGKECDVYENGKKIKTEDIAKMVESEERPFYMKTWLWRDAQIPLKIITETIDSKKELVATKIETNIEISDSQFNIPDEITVMYDEKKSSDSRRDALARFHLYKTGQPKVVKVKANKEVRTPEGKWVSEDSEKGKKITKGETKNTKTSGLLNLITGLSFN